MHGGAKMKVLVTGASGIIGTELCERLLRDKNLEVFGTCHKRSLIDGVKVVEADLTKLFKSSDLRDINPDVVVHLAHPNRGDNWQKTKNSAEIQKQALEMIGTLKAHLPDVHMVYPSSVLVYGDKPWGRPIKVSSGAHPTNQYAKAKLEVERFIEDRYPSFTTIRLGRVVSPKMNGVVNIFARKVLQNQNVDVCTIEDGRSQTYTYVTIDAAVRQLELAINHPENGFFNGYGVNMKLFGLFDRITDYAEETYKVEYNGEITSIPIPEKENGWGAMKLEGEIPQEDIDTAIEKVVDCEWGKLQN